MWEGGSGAEVRNEGVEGHVVFVLLYCCWSCPSCLHGLFLRRYTGDSGTPSGSGVDRAVRVLHQHPPKYAETHFEHTQPLRGEERLGSVQIIAPRANPNLSPRTLSRG